MKVDSRALAGIERKVTRAHEHFGFLHDEMAAWNARRPWRLVPEIHDQGRKHFYRLRFLEPIPIDWAVILGEAIHDLQSALDQCIYWLGVDWTRHEVPFCSFPVFTSRKLFYERTKGGAWSRRSGMNKIRGIGPGPQAFVEALQPYPQRYRRFYCRDVRTVHDLWNQDKHRLVHLWGLRFRDPQLRLAQYIAAESAVQFDRRILQDRAIVLKILCRAPNLDVQVKGEIGADLAFYSGKRTSGGTNESLWDIASTVADIIRKLVNAIGRQDRPISTAVWTAKGRP